MSLVSDLERNCFYALSSKNSISIYKPAGDKSIHHLQTISNLYKAAQDKAPGSPAIAPQNFQIIALHIIGESESRSGLQLLAITTNGVRLYFSPSISYNFPYGSSTSTSSGARPLQLIHVRLPPSNLLHPDEQLNLYRPPIASYGAPQHLPQPTTRPYIVSSIENTCYADGLIVAAQQGDTDGTDYILCMAPDLTRIGSLGQLNLPQQQPPAPQSYGAAYGGTSTTSRPPLTEYATILAIPGRTWAMATVPRITSAKRPSGAPAPVVINELAHQFGETPNQFMLLTNVGLTYLTKRRALDYLRAVLEELQSDGNVQPIVQFRDR